MHQFTASFYLNSEPHNLQRMHCMFSCKCNSANCHLHFSSFGRMTDRLQPNNGCILPSLRKLTCIAVVCTVAVVIMKKRALQSYLWVMLAPDIGGQWCTYHYQFAMTICLSSREVVRVCIDQSFLVFTRISIYWKRNQPIGRTYWLWFSEERKEVLKCSTMRQSAWCVCVHIHIGYIESINKSMTVGWYDICLVGSLTLWLAYVLFIVTAICSLSLLSLPGKLNKY